MKQEMRVSTTIQVMLLHVENLRRSYEKEHRELEESRRELVEHKLLPEDTEHSGDGGVGASIPGLTNRSASVVQSSSTSVSE